MGVRREEIVNSEWVDSEELLPFSADGKLLAIWARTNSHGNIAGLYRVGEAAIRFETGLSPKRFRHALEELQRAGYVRYDEPLMWVPSRAKRLSGVNPNMAKSIAKTLEEIGPHPFRREFVCAYRHTSWFQDESRFSLYERDSETLSEGFPKGSETYREQGTGDWGQGTGSRDAA